jgi:UDP-sulfoquinovose synthase
MVYDSLMRRHFDLENGFDSLVEIYSLHERVNAWREVSGKQIHASVGDTRDWTKLSASFQEFQPQAIVHFAEQRTAPYSMIDREHAIFTMDNNVVGTLNVLYALKDFAPDAHHVKLGTMGEYGTPNIDIEEGFIEIEHKGRKVRSTTSPRFTIRTTSISPARSGACGPPT